MNIRHAPPPQGEPPMPVPPGEKPIYQSFQIENPISIKFRLPDNDWISEWGNRLLKAQGISEKYEMDILAKEFKSKIDLFIEIK